MKVNKYSKNNYSNLLMDTQDKKDANCDIKT